MGRRKYPAGTTKQEWVDYEKAKKSHYAYCDSVKPVESDFKTRVDFERAFSEWDMRRFVDAPNAPGYFRANND